MFRRCPSSGGFSFSMSWVRPTAIWAMAAVVSADRAALADVLARRGPAARRRWSPGRQAPARPGTGATARSRPPSAALCAAGSVEAGGDASRGKARLGAGLVDQREHLVGGRAALGPGLPPTRGGAGADAGELAVAAAAVARDGEPECDAARRPVPAGCARAAAWRGGTVTTAGGTTTVTPAGLAEQDAVPAAPQPAAMVRESTVAWPDPVPAENTPRAR